MMKMTTAAMSSFDGDGDDHERRRGLKADSGSISKRCVDDGVQGCVET